jgi:hypothetical protein
MSPDVHGLPPLGHPRDGPFSLRSSWLLSSRGTLGRHAPPIPTVSAESPRPEPPSRRRKVLPLVHLAQVLARHSRGHRRICSASLVGWLSKIKLPEARRASFGQLTAERDTCADQPRASHRMLDAACAPCAPCAPCAACASCLPDLLGARAIEVGLLGG